MELRDYLRIARLHYKAILTFIALGLLTAWLVTLFTPRVYAATASGMVRSGVADSPAEESLGDTLAKSRAVAYVDVAKSRPVAQKAIDKLGLDTTPDALISHITVTQPVQTATIKVQARAGSPSGAQQLADTWVVALTEQIKELEDPAGKGSSIRMIPVENAALPGGPVSPNPVRNLALGFLLGGLAGSAYALLRSRIDRRIRDVDTVTRQFGVTVAGAIPASEILRRNEEGHVPVVFGGRGDSKRSQVVESFLKIRTNLQFMDIDNPPRVIVVTSPLPGDGKSTVSANLAIALAEAGESVILLDGDLRRPVVAESFGLLEGAGLTDLLTGKATLDEVAQHPAQTPNLTVVGAGSIPPNPSELLGSNVMRQLLQTLRRNHMIIVDAPPLLPVTDAAVLTANADGALVVITAGKTLDTQLDGALTSLEQVNGHVLGVIFNKIESGFASGYGNYGGYGYYGSYYGHDGAKGKGKKAKAPAAPTPARYDGPPPVARFPAPAPPPPGSLADRIDAGDVDTPAPAGATASDARPAD